MFIVYCLFTVYMLVSYFPDWIKAYTNCNSYKYHFLFASNFYGMYQFQNILWIPTQIKSRTDGQTEVLKNNFKLCWKVLKSHFKSEKWKKKRLSMKEVLQATWHLHIIFSTFPPTKWKVFSYYTENREPCSSLPVTSYILESFLSQSTSEELRCY